MFCCTCTGLCNHTGPHTYCEKHGGVMFGGQHGLEPLLAPEPPPGVLPSGRDTRERTWGCPHGRPSWQQCPHCLGINKGSYTIEVPSVMPNALIPQMMEDGTLAQRPDGSWGTAVPLGWQDETEDTPKPLRRLQRALIAAVDAWRGQRRDWRQGASW